MTKRFPAGVYGRGTEPDPRFSLANERTFLAWVRTSLALLATGVALEALGVAVSPGFRLAAAVVFIVLGFTAAAHAWFGWMRVERALREERPLPGAGVGLVAGIGVAVAVVLVLLGITW